MGYGLGAKAVKASIDKRNAQRELERNNVPAAQRGENRENAAVHYDMEKLARAIWWGLKTKRLEGFLRKPWRLTT
jgi:hypothetical protein